MRNDKEYQVERQRFHKEVEKLREEDFTAEQWKVMDDVLNEYNNQGAEHGSVNNMFEKFFSDLKEYAENTSHVLSKTHSCYR